MCNNVPITNPLSSNQIVEVSVDAPACAPKLTTLNDWLQWLGNSQCEIDWSQFDISCLTAKLGECTDCPPTLPKIIELLIKAACKTDDKCCDKEEKIDLSVILPFSGTASFIKRGSMIFLSGKVQRGTIGGTIATLPIEARPKRNMRFPIYTDYVENGAFDLWAEVTTTGNINLIATGTTPIVNNTNFIYLDGINFSTL